MTGAAVAVESAPSRRHSRDCARERMPLLEQVKETIERYRMLGSGDAVVVGVSGGPDSLCLLHLLLRLRDEYDLSLHIAHLNHCLRGAEADSDAAFVAQLAQEWDLPATVESRDVAAMAKERRLAIEEAARQARYAFLARTARQVGAQRIAVGHNADDQAETILMHWLRGAGLAGLRGMQPVSKLEEMRLGEEEKPVGQKRVDLLLIRPLLETPRAAIEAYCATHELRPRFDRSNLDTTYYRNRLRHELLPFLETFNPRIREVILRSASIFTADYAYLREQASQAWTGVTVAECPDAIAFDLQTWRALPLSLQRSTMREAIHRLRRSLRNINWVHVENALEILQAGTTGMTATLPRGLEARLGYDRLIVCNVGYVAPPPDLPLMADTELTLRVPGQTPLPGSGWSISAQVVERQTLDEQALRQADPWQAYLDLSVTGSELRLRTRRTGDRFRPQGMGGKSTTVHSFMINAKIPYAWRDRIPLLVSPSQVLWIAGWRIDERAKVTNRTQQVLALSFEKHSRE
jgi:tRNA(Ile)-lysidine synthase